MDNGGLLQYIGGTTGAIALTGVAAASALYLATRPKPEKPLVPLDQQTVVIKETVDVSKKLLSTLKAIFKTNSLNFLPLSSLNIVYLKIFVVDS